MLLLCPVLTVRFVYTFFELLLSPIFFHLSSCLSYRDSVEAAEVMMRKLLQMMFGAPFLPSALESGVLARDLTSCSHSVRITLRPE